MGLFSIAKKLGRRRKIGSMRGMLDDVVNPQAAPGRMNVIGPPAGPIDAFGDFGEIALRVIDAPFRFLLGGVSAGATGAYKMMGPPPGAKGAVQAIEGAGAAGSAGFLKAGKSFGDFAINHPRTTIGLGLAAFGGVSAISFIKDYRRQAEAMELSRGKTMAVQANRVPVSFKFSPRRRMGDMNAGNVALASHYARM